MNSKVKRIEQPDFKVPEIQRPDYSYWYKDRPINQKRGNYNTYLDSIQINWWDIIEWIALWSALEYNILPLKKDNSSFCGELNTEFSLWIPTTFYDSITTWKLNWETTPDWWIIIPADWNYIVSVLMSFYLSLNTSSLTPSIWTEELTISWTTFDAIDNNNKIIMSAANIEKYWDTPTDWLYLIESNISFSTNTTSSYTFNSKFKKWNVLYLMADHRRDWISYVIVWTYYITKIS